GSEAPLRGLIVHKVFAEMYNLKAIASLLVRLPARSKEADKIVHDPSTDDCAGPPFQMSNTFAFPRHATGRWRLHRALVLSALEFSEALLKPDDGRHLAEEIPYLRNLHKLDTDSKVWIDHVIAG